MGSPYHRFITCFLMMFRSLCAMDGPTDELRDFRWYKCGRLKKSGCALKEESLASASMVKYFVTLSRRFCICRNSENTKIGLTLRL
jgi:hypothetical protein